MKPTKSWVISKVISLFECLSSTRWWFQIFFVFIPIPGEMIQFDLCIFFKWVETQPPPSDRIHHVCRFFLPKKRTCHPPGRSSRPNPFGPGSWWQWNRWSWRVLFGSPDGWVGPPCRGGSSLWKMVLVGWRLWKAYHFWTFFGWDAQKV